MNDLGVAVRVIVRVAIAMAILGVLVAIVVGVATASFAIVGLLVAVGVVVQASRWVAAHFRRGHAPQGITGIHREDRVDPTTGAVRRTTIIDVD